MKRAGQDEKVEQNRLRRAADRQDWTLRKSRRRDPRAVDFGALTLHNESGQEVGPFRDLLELERWLDADPIERPYTSRELADWRAGR